MSLESALKTLQAKLETVTGMCWDQTVHNRFYPMTDTPLFLDGGLSEGRDFAAGLTSWCNDSIGSNSLKFIQPTSHIGHIALDIGTAPSEASIERLTEFLDNLDDQQRSTLQHFFKTKSAAVSHSQPHR